MTWLSKLEIVACAVLLIMTKVSTSLLTLISKFSKSNNIPKDTNIKQILRNKAGPDYILTLQTDFYLISRMLMNFDYKEGFKKYLNLTDKLKKEYKIDPELSGSLS